MKQLYHIAFPIAVSAVLLLFYACSHKRDLKQTKSGEIERKIDSLLSIMTLEEKIGQMTLFTSDFNVTGPTIRENYKADIKAGKVGAVFNAFGAAYTRELQKMAVENTRLGIPLLLGYDVIHGFRTIFPIPLGEAASWDLASIENSARIAAVEATADGLHWTFAPMVDIARDPRWGRIAEGAGEDTYLGSVIAKAKVKGFQNGDLYKTNTLVACAKHFVAYGAALAGRDYNIVDMSERTLREIYLPPFKAAVEEGVGTIMTSFNEINGVPATGNRMILTDILKIEWGFDGFVVTDYTSINEMVPHGVVMDEKEAGKLAVNAGVDMDMQGAVFYNYLAESVEQGGDGTMSRIDDAVRRILRIKYLLGLFEDAYRYCDEQKEKELVLLHPDHIAFARVMARRSIVLLKNKGDLLPLDQNITTLAVVGPLADNKKEMIGPWSAAGDYTRCVSLLEGIKKQAHPNTRILFAKGCNIDDTHTYLIREAVAVARKADVVILAVGEAAWMSGEAASRSMIGLPGVQQELVKRIYETGKPVIVVLMNGRPLAIPWIAEHIPAILETWFLGTTGGDAISDVIFGKYNPSGKLPVTFPRNEGQIPIFYNAKNTGRPISDNKYTSKYLDVPNTPLYPFGYGLSYTTFEYSNIILNKNEISYKDTLKAMVEVTNTGPEKGEEVVQMYIRDLAGSVTRPLKELKGFQKIKLEPGVTTRVTFTITSGDLKYYDINMEYKVEPGDFVLFIGTNSIETREAYFTLIE